jgi:hypothetical protein
VCRHINLPLRARELEKPVVVHATSPKTADWPRQKSLLALENPGLELLYLQNQGAGLRVGVQNSSEEMQRASVLRNEESQSLGEAGPLEIKEFTLDANATR